jgi:hypothetical protein
MLDPLARIFHAPQFLPKVGNKSALAAFLLGEQQGGFMRVEMKDLMQLDSPKT